MKYLIVVTLFALSFVMPSCKAGTLKEADAFIAARDEVTTAWAKEMEANPNETGLANMQKIFDSKKADLAAKKEAFMKVSDDANNATWARLSDTNSMERKLKDAAITKFATSSAAVSENLRKLFKDYQDTVEIPHLI